MSTLTATKTHAINDIVTFAPEVGWPKKNMGMRLIVTKVPTRRNEVNFIVAPVDAEGNAIEGAQGFKGPAYAFIPATDDNAAAAPAPRVHVPVSSIVFVGDDVPMYPTGYYTVIGDVDHERVRIMAIGGNGRSYYRAYAKHLTVIEPKDVLAALALI